MKKICKELIAICLLIGIFCSAFPLKGVQAANTSGSFEQRILQLQQKFPAGKYWNHMGSSVNNPDGYTNIPCTHHGNCSKNGYGGWCGCNSFNGQSIQCFGFAEKLGYDVFGTNPRTSWIKYNSLSNVRPGDIIRYKNNGHSIFVTNVVGDTITFADCNSDNHCKIRWNATINKANIVNFNYVKHANNYDDVISVPEPSTPTPPQPITPNPVIDNVKIDSIDFNHISLRFSAYNSGLVRIVAVSQTTGQEVKQDFTNGLENVSYTFQTSSMTNPGKDFYIRIYAYSTPTGGNETLHAVTYGPNIGSVRLPDKELRYNMETVPQGTISTTTSLVGWVIGENITKVTAVINSHEYECTRVKREDVGNAFPGYDYSKAGFQLDFDTSYLVNGNNTLSVRGYTSDMDYVELYNGNVEAVKLASFYVDWSWYYFKYHNEPEVAAIGLNPPKLIEYYYSKGIAKGHSPCVGFDPAWYLEKNKDLKAVGNITDYVGAYVHFVKYCLPDNEKRELSPFLNLQYYQTKNEDLVNMNAEELFYHYYVYGSRMESRIGNNSNQAKAFSKLFVVSEYAEANQDIKDALGDGKTVESAERIWSQFFVYTLSVDYGQRVTSKQFDMKFYINKYGLSTTEEAFWRYINSGYANGEITKQVVTMAPTETSPAKPSQGATPVQVSTPPPIIVTEKPQTEIPKNTETPKITETPKNTETPQITIRPIDTEIPTKTVQPETTLVVPTSTPVIDEDFSGDLITEISLYSDLDEGEQLRVGDSFTIYTDVYPVIFEDTELQWLSSDKKIATVNKKGDVQCVGVGTVMITAMATDGSGKSASMTFKVEKAISNDNNLSNIKFSQGKLTPAFKKNKKSYSLVLSKNMSKVVIKVKKSDSAATVKINGKAIEKITVKLKRGQTKKITIRVIAENGKGKTYQIKVKRKK
ncbi:MAG: cadherin-like beta sandwich domain-containing protein [Lachnospiraceae bacterium]|nr:cadherin-like beta sandwich domain-containing protein [Lachnospiraceae bacterium]